MTKPPAVMKPFALSHLTFSGSPRHIGAAYGQAFAAGIHGFYRQEVGDPDRPRAGEQRLAQAASRAATRHTPQQALLVKGLAVGAGLTMEQATLLSLHEELVHSKHCTAVVASGAATQRAGLVAQNWDWSPSLYAWPGVVTLKPTRGLATLTYHYPGLWSCCGVNAAGLALMWTGSAYYPSVPPRSGVATYPLIAQILQAKTVPGAIDLLKKIPRAGSFIFLIADAQGQAITVEATPTHLVIKPVAYAAARANHYVDAVTQKASQQKLPADSVYNTRARYSAAGAATSGVVRFDAKMAQRLLRTPPIYRREAGSFTLDSLIADCQQRTLSICRGDSERWVTFTL